MTPRDAFGRRVYLAPLGLTISVEGAAITELSLVPAELRVEFTLAAHARAPSREATLFLEVERIEPPPPARAAEYVVACEGAGATDQGCVKPAQAPGLAPGSEYVVTMVEGRRLSLSVKTG